MKYLIVILLIGGAFLIYSFNNNKLVHYEVDAKNGGENGFNDISCSYNGFTGVYKANYANPGNEVYAPCCDVEFSDELLAVRDRCDLLATQNKDTSGSFVDGNYIASFQFTDQNNFKYSIRKTE